MLSQKVLPFLLQMIGLQQRRFQKKLESRATDPSTIYAASFSKGKRERNSAPKIPVLQSAATPVVEVINFGILDIRVAQLSRQGAVGFQDIQVVDVCVRDVVQVVGKCFTSAQLKANGEPLFDDKFQSAAANDGEIR